MITAIQRAKSIKLLICDIDGVMTDGGLYFDENGAESKRFYARDGLGIRWLQQHADIPTAIISGRRSSAVNYRAKNLNIDERLIHQACLNKQEALHAILQYTKVQTPDVAYIGDDAIDLPVMTQVGLACAVQDAETIVKEYAHYICPNKGGNGAVRNVCDLILKAQGLWEGIIDSYIKKPQ